MTRNIRKAVLAGLGIAALAGVSSVASAQNTTYIGTLAGTFTQSGVVANYAWDGHNALGAAQGLGWGHNSRWYTFSIASTSSLNINMTSSALNPAFSLWQTTGYTDPALVSNAGHTYSQVSTHSPASNWLTDPAQGGVTAFLGYANSGPAFTNGVGLSVGSGSAGSSVSTGVANLITTLGAGNYLLAIGGSNYVGDNALKGAKAFSLTLTQTPAPAVPIPAAVWMVGSALASVAGVSRRKKKLQTA